MNKYDKVFRRVFANLDKRSNYYLDDRCDDDYYTLKELVEKATPKKVIVNGIREGRTINTVSYTCPNCNNHIGRDCFCKHCGQAMDWSNEG